MMSSNKLLSIIIGTTRTRLVIALGTLWFVVAFNLERLQLAFLPVIDISNVTYGIVVLMGITILSFPNLGLLKPVFALVSMLIMFVGFTTALDLWPRYADQPLLIGIDAGILIISYFVNKIINDHLLDLEIGLQIFVLQLEKSQIVTPLEGRYRLQRELQRASHFHRQVACVYCEVYDENAAEHRLPKLVDLESHITYIINNHYQRVVLAKNISALMYKSDILLPYRNGFLVFLTETEKEQVARFLYELALFNEAYGHFSLLAGEAYFPENGQSIDELASVASSKVHRHVDTLNGHSTLAKDANGITPFTIPIDEAHKQVEPSNGNHADELVVMPSKVHHADTLNGITVTQKNSEDTTSFTAPIDEAHKQVEPSNGNHVNTLDGFSITKKDGEDTTPFNAPADEAHEELKWITELKQTPGAKQVFSSIWENQDKARKGAVAVDIETRINIEKQSEWLNKLAYQSPSSRLIYQPLKRIIDIVLTLISAPILLPVVIIVSILIYLDDGLPLLYVQERTGFGGKRFKMYKFRTMMVNAPSLPTKVIHMPDGQVRHVWPDKVENDPRITRVGRILRKTSLDEIPQLWNVLIGNMSIIGPRPTSWGVNMYTSLQTERLSVRPGITGLWQVSARETKNFDERLIWDVKYVEKMSLWLDLQILWRTISQVFHRKGA